MKKVLINNAHNDTFGGGELYTLQVSKAVSQFCDVSFIKKPNPIAYKNNPNLSIENPKVLCDTNESFDYFLNISHFQSEKYPLANKNIKVVFFPKENLTVSGFDEIVSITDYSNKYVKEYWGREGLVCQPYSNNVVPLTKKEKTISSIGNFFYEPDGHSKGFHYLIDAFKMMGDGYKLTLMGHEISKPYINHLKKVSEGLDVEILTDVSEQKKISILGESQFYWHANGYLRGDPGQVEHFGIAPEEALKAGCLSYVHNSGGAKEFCTSWDTLEELVNITKEKKPNPKHSLQTPNDMLKFWKDLLV
jgi:hypothetical protein